MLPIVANVFQLFTAAFLVITAIFIEIIFKGDKKPKPKKRNLINFKTLNIFYGLMMILSAVPSIVYIILGYDIDIILPFKIVLGSNVILLSFVMMNEEVKKFFLSKIKNWCDMRKDNQRIQISMETQHTLWAERKRSQRGQHENERNNEIFVIDIEN